MEINREDLITALTFCNSCSGVKDVRAYLNGVLLEFRNQTLEVVGCDGHRIAKMTIPVLGGAVGECDIIVPTANVKELLTWMNLWNTGVVEINPGEGLTVATSFGYIFERYDGKYPNWRRVLGSGENLTLSVIGLNAKYLTEAIKAYRPILGKDKYAAVKLTPSANGGLIIEPVQPHHLDPILQIMPVRL